MSGLLDEIDRTLILVRILSEENEGMWGFSPPGPYHRDEFRVFHVDSDDTAYAMKLLNYAPRCARDSEELSVDWETSKFAWRP
jgi:hypothetical protein